MKFLSRFLVITITLGALSVGSAGAAMSPAALSGPQVGSPAPDFALPTIAGKTVRLSDFRGKTLVINIWATWCPPCREETPGLVKSYAALHRAKVAFLGVDSSEQAPIVRAFVAAKGVPYTEAIDGAKAFADAYDIRYFPTTFVIDPSGIVRARYIDVIAPKQLASFVESAKRGENGVLRSPLQAKIDASLALEKFTYTGDHDAIVAAVKAASEAIDKAENSLGESDAAKGNPTDLLRTRAEEAAVREGAIDALGKVATDADKAMLLRLQADAALNVEHWADAIDGYRGALALKPDDQDALGGLALAANGAKDRRTQIEAYRGLTKLHPDLADNYVDLSQSYALLKEFPQAEAAGLKAVELATAAYAKEPKNAAAIRKVAWTHMYAGRAFAKAGERTKARAQFMQLTAWTMKLPKNDLRYAMYLEEAQEAQVALALDAAKQHGATSLSLAAWTGPDLPGSIPGTYKYRLVVAGVGGKNVDLRAVGVPKNWIASFCSDRVCAPFHLPVTLPAQGVKVVEFQLVPDKPNAKSGAHVSVIATGGGRTTRATIVAAR